MGNVIFVLLYLALNVLCLFVAPGTSSHMGRGWGSLAACNSMLLILPAARNSVLVVGLGIPFDHAVLYHRFIGRFAVLCVVLHALYYLGSYSRNKSAYVTGMTALACGVVIYITSLNYVRRHFFNVFYWAHYAFVGYLVMAYIHVPQTKPFILAGIVLYLADKLLRWVWMLWPHTTEVFKTKNSSIVQVRFPKNPITARLGMHRVGQYYFVNFPALSLTEWHPFSVSSGPREDSIELHIRDLGDHTKRIVALAQEKERVNEATTICIDGPYGFQNFNYRRYPIILLAAGGIGVTPIVGMLKEIYDLSLPSNTPKCRSHAVDTIYLLWVMPHAEDYECFRLELEACIAQSATAGYPNLIPLVYITRAKDEMQPPFFTGRPKIGNIFKAMLQQHPQQTQAGLVFACGPHALVSELWDKTIQCTVSGRRFDFHHEVFDF